jgi:hypothetical protein
LHLNLTGIALYSLAYDSSFSNRIFLPYGSAINFSVPDATGEYPIYLKFRTTAGRESQVYKILIEYAKPVTASPAPSSTPTEPTTPAAPVSPVSQPTNPTAPASNPPAAPSPALSASKIRTILNHVTGHILLQVQSHGEGWYVDPVSRKRTALTNGESARAIIQAFGLGISNTDLAKLQAGNKTLINKLRGRIVIAVRAKGEAYYINPTDGKVYFLANGDTAYRLFVKLGLGISNIELSAVEIK